MKILQPGLGVGSHCIAVDPWFIVSSYPQQAKIISGCKGEVTILKRNGHRRRLKEPLEVLKQQLGRTPKVACLGLAFKPNIDVIWESPALHLVEMLMEKKYNILPVEPNVRSNSPGLNW